MYVFSVRYDIIKHSMVVERNGMEEMVVIFVS